MSLNVASENLPKVSIIIATFNAEAHIEKAVLSVLAQTYENVELIIMDGASTDKTVSKIKQLQSSSTNIRLVSEPDNGIYNAWNKGLKLAQGQYISFIGADDWLDKDAIANVLTYLHEVSELLTFGNVNLVDEVGNIRYETGQFSPDNLHRGFGFRTTTVFFNRLTFESVGMFNETYKIAGDSEWLLRAYLNGVKFAPANNLTFMGLGGVSNKLEFAAYKEYFVALKQHKLLSMKSFVVLFKKWVKSKLV